MNAILPRLLITVLCDDTAGCRPFPVVYRPTTARAQQTIGSGSPPGSADEGQCSRQRDGHGTHRLQTWNGKAEKRQKDRINRSQELRPEEVIVQWNC